jgi:hypothetical protein
MHEFQQLTINEGSTVQAGKKHNLTIFSFDIKCLFFFVPFEKSAQDMSILHIQFYIFKFTLLQ